MVINHQNPKVSVIIPCYNEELTILDTLEAINSQSFPSHDFEVVVADGMSTDRTRLQIKQFARQHPHLKIKIVDNRARVIPSALNNAIKASQGEIIVRLDAHAAPSQEYIERVVKAIESGKGDNVGGVWDIQPGKDSNNKVTWIARSIAAAASNPIGVGNALYRYTTKPQFTDTVPFGSFRKDLLEKIGYFNEKLLTNEDYEFNVRIKKSGGKIWLDPAIRSIYYARSTFSGLIRQYWRYGFWKAKMLVNFPSSLRLRQVLPPLFVLFLILLVSSMFWVDFAGLALLVLLTTYLTVLLAAGVRESFKAGDFSLTLGVPISIGCMHLAWGMGFWAGLISNMTGTLLPRSASKE